MDPPPPIVQLTYGSPPAVSPLRPLIRLIGAATFVYSIPLFIRDFLINFFIYRLAASFGLYIFRFRLPRHSYTQWIAEIVLILAGILTCLPVPRARRTLLIGAGLEIILIFADQYALHVNHYVDSYLLSVQFGIFVHILNQILLPVLILILLNSGAFRRAYAPGSLGSDPFPMDPAADPAQSPLRWPIRIYFFMIAGVALIDACQVVMVASQNAHFRPYHFIIDAIMFVVNGLALVGAVFCFRGSPPGRRLMLLSSWLFIVFDPVVLGYTIYPYLHGRSYYPAASLITDYGLTYLSRAALSFLTICLCLHRPFRPAFDPA